MKLRRIGKKGDLSLSINAIVILILAITMLGLGLGFLRGTFTKTTKSFQEVADEVKTQITDKIKASNEKVAFDRLEVELKRGESKDMYYGIRNVLEASNVSGSLTFDITADCDKALKSSTDATKIEFETFSTWDVKQGEIEVLKLVVRAKTDAALDTYSCALNVKQNSVEYAVKKFFVTVTAT